MLIAVLTKSFSKPVSYINLYFSLYSMRHDDEQPSMDILKVNAHHMRKLIKGTGYTLRTLWGFGFCFERDD